METAKEIKVEDSADALVETITDAVRRLGINLTPYLNAKGAQVYKTTKIIINKDGGENKIRTSYFTLARGPRKSYLSKRRMELLGIPTVI
jgi:hypothetical protein